MAGYTSRIFLTLTIPSIFGFLSVLWFLKKRRGNTKKVCWNKGIQVEKDSKACEDIFESKDQYLIFSPMKLKEQVSSHTEDEHIQLNSSEMQLKETQTVDKHCQHTNGVSTQSPKVKGKKKGKSMVHENGTTCSVKEPASNGCKVDNTTSTTEDIKNGLTNGMEALSLNKSDSVQNGGPSQTANGASTETEVSNGTAKEIVRLTPKLYSCHFKQQSNSSGVTMDTDKKTCPEPTNESPVLEPAKELCDMEVNSERNCDIPQACAADTIETANGLFLPVNDCTVMVACQAEMLESPGAKYCDSVGSSDSGKGGSEIQFLLEHNALVVYEFQILQELCGLLIGRNGRHVNYIKQETNANILIKRHPYYNQMKICSITGQEEEINASLKLIRKRFPIEVYPSVTLAKINVSTASGFQLPEFLKLNLPEGVSFEASLCSTVSAGHFFLQQPTHPTFHSLPALTISMSGLYSSLETPELPEYSKGIVCVANLSGGWFRAEIDEVMEENQCSLKFLDYGGYAVVPGSSLRQIRYDYMNIPFQACECFLGSVTFLEGETGWSLEASMIFEEIAQGQIVQGFVIGYSENRIPFVHLHKITGATTTFINRELVNRGVARWIGIPL